MAKLTPQQTLALRCETARIVAVAAADSTVGAIVENPDGSVSSDMNFGVILRPVPRLGGVDGKLVAAVFEAGAYAQTMWELIQLRSLEAYQTFDASYDTLVNFLDDPSRGALHKYGVTITQLFSNAATLRGIAATCPAASPLFGLLPPDPSILPENLPEDFDPIELPPRAPRHAVRHNKTFGGAVLGTMFAGAAMLGGAALISSATRRR